MHAQELRWLCSRVENGVRKPERVTRSGTKAWWVHERGGVGQEAASPRSARPRKRTLSFRTEMSYWDYPPYAIRRGHTWMFSGACVTGGHVSGRRGNTRQPSFSRTVFSGQLSVKARNDQILPKAVRKCIRMYPCCPK